MAVSEIEFVFLDQVLPLRFVLVRRSLDPFSTSLRGDGGWDENDAGIADNYFQCDRNILCNPGLCHLLLLTFKPICQHLQAFNGLTLGSLV